MQPRSPRPARALQVGAQRRSLRNRAYAQPERGRRVAVTLPSFRNRAHRPHLARGLRVGVPPSLTGSEAWHTTLSTIEGWAKDAVRTTLANTADATSSPTQSATDSSKADATTADTTSSSVQSATESSETDVMHSGGYKNGALAIFGVASLVVMVAALLPGTPIIERPYFRYTASHREQLGFKARRFIMCVAKWRKIDWVCHRSSEMNTRK